MPDHDRPERERDAGDRERRLQRDAGDHARQRDRDDDEERDRVDAEEAVARDGEGRRGAEHERDRRRGAGGLEREHERVAHLLVVPGDAEPARREVLDRPALDVRAVEGVEHDHRQRHVQEQHDEQRPDAQERAGGPRFHGLEVLEGAEAARAEQVDGHDHERHGRERGGEGRVVGDAEVAVDDRADQLVVVAADDRRA